MNIYDNRISVSALNGYIKTLMDSDDFLSGVAICGEISNFKRNASGHLYFSLKDEGAAVSAVMFRGAASRLAFLPCDGMKVTAYGRVSLYEKTGQYQVYVETMTSDGEGALARAYEALKRKLEAEGIFAADKKKKLPEFPKRIGIITSPTGAAVRDMINVTGRRYPLADILLFPSAVQGAEAPLQLCMGVHYFNAMQNVDVIIIGRGGGSIEDLWAFNDETLVRIVANSEIPIISAVGHETDFTLCDFAADRRAPTPSAAAEIAVPDISVIENSIGRHGIRMNRAVIAGLAKRTEDVFNMEKIITLNSPASKLERARLKLANLRVRIENSTDIKLRDAKKALGEISATLAGMNPMAVLSRGYSVIEDEAGKKLSSVSQLNLGQRIDITMSDGKASASVTEIKNMID